MHRQVRAILPAALASVFVFVLHACTREPAPVEPAAAPATMPAQQSQATQETQALPSFVGKVWMSTTPAHARGTVLVFLPDKSVLRTSCQETFRVARWGIISDTRIRWIEDRFPIEAEWSQPTASELILEPVGTGKREHYVTISVPYVCSG